jgi:hypothetical protein
MDLGQRQMFNLSGYLLRSQTQVVTSGNPPNGDTGGGDARPAFTDLWRSLDQGPNVDYGGHSVLDSSSG